MKKKWRNIPLVYSSKNKKKEIIGVLNPIEWDKEGEVKKYSIYTVDEEDIIIEEIFPNIKLKHLLNKKVLAKGILREDKEGQKFIKLKTIKQLIEPNSPATNLLKKPIFNVWPEEYELSIPKDYQFASTMNLSENYF